MDERPDRRPPRHSAQRLSGRGERIVVQRRMLHARAGRQTRRQSLRQGLGVTPGTHAGVVRRTVPPAGRLSGRFRRDGRARQIDAPQHDRRLRAGLQDARRRAATGGDPHRAPAPAHPQGAADTLAPQPALQRFAGGRIARRTRFRGQERFGMALAAAILRQGMFRYRQGRIPAAGPGDTRQFRRGHPELRHRVDL